MRRRAGGGDGIDNARRMGREEEGAGRRARKGYGEAPGSVSSHMRSEAEEVVEAKEV